MKINSFVELKDYIIKLTKDKNISKQHDFIYDNELIELTQVQRFRYDNLLPEYFDWLEYDTLYMITPWEKSKREGVRRGIERKIFYYYRPSDNENGAIYYTVKSAVTNTWLSNQWFKKDWMAGGSDWIRAYAKIDDFKELRSLMNWNELPWGGK
tara:strand:- start:298 stop:759 length:462 start_codon:yes stop_codon:yes gene_type:complete